MELPFDPAIPLLELYPKNPQTPIQKNLCTLVFLATQFTIAKCWKQPKCPSVNEWIKKLYMMEYYTVERKKELLPFSATWMDMDNSVGTDCGNGGGLAGGGEREKIWTTVRA